jgi:hypothetical protein
MTQTSPQRTERLTSRQRRIEEQRRKIDSARRQQRQRQLLIGGGIVVAVIAVVAAVWFLIPRAPETMRQVPIESGTHVDPSTPLTYRNRPPSSGMHFAAVPQASDYRMYDQPVTPGLWVHMLEHGAVAILYRPDLCNQDCVAQLGQVYDRAPRSQTFGVRKLALLPYTDMDHAVAVVAWGYVDEMDVVDQERILNDYRSRLDKGPENAL